MYGLGGVAVEEILWVDEGGDSVQSLGVGGTGYGGLGEGNWRCWVGGLRGEGVVG